MSTECQNETAPDAARLIAEMFEAISWSIPRARLDHPILGPAIALRRETYAALRGQDFTAARIAADEAAIRYIMEAATNAGR